MNREQHRTCTLEPLRTSGKSAAQIGRERGSDPMGCRGGGQALQRFRDALCKDHTCVP